MTATPRSVAAAVPRTTRKRRPRNQDSIPKRIVIHAILILASLIAVFPVIRVLGVALRPGDQLLDPNFKLIPDGATLAAFGHVIFNTALSQWLFNSLVITVGTSIVGLIFAALLFGTLQQGGLAVNAFVPKELMDVLTGIVVCAVALADEAIGGRGASSATPPPAPAAKAAAS